MRKIKKVNKRKFISRIAMLLVILIAIILLFKAVLKKNVPEIINLTLIVDNQDITESLDNDIYIDGNKNLYMSMEDVKKVFDSTLYFEEETGKIIMTSDTKVAAIDVNNNTFELNDATLLLSSGILKQETGYYIPVSDITNVYNFEISTTETTAIINSLYKELITVKTTKKSSLKENTGFFADTIQKLEEGKELIFLDNAEKSGWIKVLTYEGNFGYIKEKYVSDKEYKRKNMEDSDFSSKTTDVENAIELTKKTIKSDNLKDFNVRKKTVQDTISSVISKEKYTVNLNLKEVDVESDYLERFIIELIPRLKEIGGSLVITNNSILSSEFLNENNL